MVVSAVWAIFEAELVTKRFHPFHASLEISDLIFSVGSGVVTDCANASVNLISRCQNERYGSERERRAESVCKYRHENNGHLRGSRCGSLVWLNDSDRESTHTVRPPAWCRFDCPDLD
mgnify:CR=1 FL=1